MLQMAEHRAWQVGLRDKIKLQWAAIAALPQELRAAALVPDATPIPPRRQLPTETPPIKGWYEQKLADAEDVMKSTAALGVSGKRR